jgi:uncharacterized membrane protein YhhN
LTTAILIAAALAVVGMLVSEARYPRAEWFFKPLASGCFILLALTAGAMDSGYGQWLLAGLVLCMAGDVLLIPQGDRTFLAGLASFLAGHLLYALAFLQLPLNLIAMLIGLLPVITLAVFSLRWLWPHLPDHMQVPVVAYIGVICTMLLMAGSTWGSGPGFLVLTGAWGFAISDLAVARNQFVKPGMKNRVWGLPLYFSSQLLLAWSPALLPPA